MKRQKSPKLLEATLETDCRHIAPSDDAFTARMRFHQSWYRRHVLGLPPGPNPNAAGALYGNILCEHDGVAGWNFVTGAIHTYAEDRLAKDPTHIEPHRLRNNLLSSQPLCFNLFVPLALDLTLTTKLVSTLPGLEHIKRVTAVKLEYAPTPRIEFLNDGTSFDAWVEYERMDGKLGFIGIETKLTEPFSNANYPFDARYARWMTKGDWWWQPGAETAFPNLTFNQLWRNHLLAFALQHKSPRNYAECYCAVVSHPLDAACPKAVTAYAAHLLPAGNKTLLSWPLNILLNTWRPLATTREEHFWIQALRLRYLDLEASEASWCQRPDREQTLP